MNLRELQSSILTRAMIIFVRDHLEWDAAKRRAAQEIAAEYKLKTKAVPRSKPAPMMPPSACDDNELNGAKDRFFGKLTNYFARFDANRARERAARRAAKRAAKQSSVQRVIKPVTPTATVAQPDDQLPSDNVYSFPLVYTSGVHTAQYIDDNMYTQRHRDNIATRNWRASIAANELKKGTKS